MHRPKKIPSYRHHKPSGQAVVTIAGKDIYLGQFGSNKSHKAYQRTLKSWLATGEVSSARQPSLTIDDVMAAYWTFAEAYYQRNGQPTGECNNIRYALRPLHDLYGDTPAVKFGPRDLKVLQHAMVDAGHCRNVVNARIRKIKRMFKWAVSEEKLPARVYQGLTTVDGIKKFRTTARETPPVTAVSDAVIESTLPFLPGVVQDMVRIQRACGPSQRDRSKRNPLGKPGTRYTRQAYLLAIRRACKRAGVPMWSPNQLRHRLATDVREKYGVEIVAAILGHSKPSTSWIYVDRQLRQAGQAISEIG